MQEYLGARLGRADATGRPSVNRSRDGQFGGPNLIMVEVIHDKAFGLPGSLYSVAHPGQIEPIYHQRRIANLLPWNFQR